ncbi:hypothetical protein GCM10010206_79410 [Streptomyces cinerochromogenes]|nr:hypothetical protein GCM10010206_79410 [Streptomyces cinerochromogenes]
MTELIGHSGSPAQLPGTRGAFGPPGFTAGRQELASTQSRVGLDANAQQGEYTTYAPKGEKCRRCHKPFASLEVVRRVKPSGEEPNRRPYACVECPTEGKS